jgi:transposase-like protein
MSNGNRFTPEVKDRAVRLVFDQVKGNEKIWPAIVSVATKIGCTAETLRRWVRQAERDAGKREGLTTDERARLKAPEKENRELNKANGILRLASAFPHKRSSTT